MEKFLDKLKEIWGVVTAFIGGAFVIYAYLATIVMTAQLLAEQLNFENTGLFAFIIVSVLTYVAYKKFSE